MAEIVTVGKLAPPQPPGGRRRVRMLADRRVSLSGHAESLLTAGQEVELPAHIWPSLLATGAAEVIEAPAPVAPKGRDVQDLLASPASASSDLSAAEADGASEPEDLPAPRSQRRLVRGA